MALIKCPECGKDISDTVETCIHCGFSLAEYKINQQNGKNNFVYYQGKKYNLQQVVDFVNSHDLIYNKDKEHDKITREYNVSALHKMEKIIPELDGEVPSLYELLSYIKRYGEAPREEFLPVGDPNRYDLVKHPNYKPKEAIEVEHYTPKPINQLYCPICGSTQVTTGSRGFSLLTGFIGSNKTVNRCGKCGHKWTPRKW